MRGGGYGGDMGEGGAWGDLGGIWVRGGGIWLAGWLAGWLGLAGWLAVWLAGWQVILIHTYLRTCIHPYIHTPPRGRPRSGESVSAPMISRGRPQ